MKCQKKKKIIEAATVACIAGASRTCDEEETFNMDN